MSKLLSPSSILIVLLSLALTGTVAASAGATVYHVSPAGNDASSGTAGLPWRTLQKAADTAVAGDTVLVDDGTYAGMFVGGGGTAGNPVVFKANGSNALVNSQNATTIDNINIEFANYVVVDGFRVDNAPRAGIRVVESRGVVIRNNVISNSQQWGILCGFTPDVQIVGNTAYATVGEHGIYVANSRDVDDNVLIRGNESYGNGQSGIQLNGDCLSGGDGSIGGAVIENNVVHDNGWKGFSLIGVQSSIIQNNVVYNNGQGGVGAGGIHLVEQPGCESFPSFNNVVVNNTVIEPTLAGIRMNPLNFNNVVFNNIVLGKNSVSVIADDDGGNSVDPASNVLLVPSDPLAAFFVDAANHDYHLLPGAAAVDRGSGSYLNVQAPTVDYEGQVRPQGSTYDSGADEHSSGPPPNDVTAPTVSVTSPTPAAFLQGTVTFEALASDNVGVAGVELRLDGIAVGAELTFAPYRLTVNSALYANGGHSVTAIARDTAGNSATSTAVQVTIDNSSPSGIPTAHPRLILTPTVLSELRARACYDANGNPIPNCTPSVDWTRFVSNMAQGWHYALAYQITHDPSYIPTALSLADDRVAQGINGYLQWNSKFLYIRDFYRDVALVYDWLFDSLGAQRKSDYIDYFNVGIFCLQNAYNSPAAGGPNDIYTWTGWAIDDPGNNVHANFLLAMSYAALATFGENPGTFTYNGTQYNLYLPFSSVPAQAEVAPVFTGPDALLDLVNYKFHNRLLPDRMNAFQMQGGGQHEGDNYGEDYKVMIFEAFLLHKSANNDNFFDLTDFDRDAVMYHLHATQPGDNVMYHGGDISRDLAMAVSPYSRQLMRFLADGLEGTLESQYAQYYANNIYTTYTTGWAFLFPWDFILNRPTLAETDYKGVTPTQYFAPGYGWVVSRDSWADDATCVSFLSTGRLEGHQHNDQNSFLIFKGVSTLGWQAIDAHQYAGDHLHQESSAHNTILIDGEGQRFGPGTGAVTKYEAGTDYTYLVGDASDAYWTNPGFAGHGDTKMIDVFQREFVHVFPGYVFIFDRITPSPGFVGSQIKYLLNVHNQPTIQGDEIVALNDQGKLFQRTLLPVGAPINAVPLNFGGQGQLTSWRVEISPPVQSDYELLNVIYVDDAGVTAMPPVSQVSSVSGNMVGARLEDASRDIVVMFSTDPGGGVPSGTIQYEVGYAPVGSHMLADLLAGVGYQVDVSVHAGVQSIAVSEGGPWVTSSTGVLRFQIIDGQLQSIGRVAGR